MGENDLTSIILDVDGGLINTSYATPTGDSMKFAFGDKAIGLTGRTIGVIGEVACITDILIPVFSPRIDSCSIANTESLNNEQISFAKFVDYGILKRHALFVNNAFK